MGQDVRSVQALAVLYDLALTIGSEATLDELLVRTLQRFLYHTGIPAGLVYTAPEHATEDGTVDAEIETAIGNYELLKRKGERLHLPAYLLGTGAAVIDDETLLSVFPARRPYRYALHLPVAGFGGLLLLGHDAPKSSLPLTELFKPIMARLGTAITLCRRIEERTAALERANRELEAFSYSVSHDLRAPLRVLDGFAGMLIEDYGERLDDEGKRLLRSIQGNALRMNQLIDDILRFSRVGRSDMSLEPVDMAALAAEVVDELQGTLTGRSVRFAIGDLPPVAGDRAMLRQVLVNLLSNAVKFSQPRAEAFIEVGAEEEPEAVCYFVRDNGVGFDMQFAGKLFGVFERLHGVKQFEGTGIGLAIVKRIVERHGGSVSADSAPDRGAQFRFRLPKQAVAHVR